MGQSDAGRRNAAHLDSTPVFQQRTCRGTQSSRKSQPETTVSETPYYLPVGDEVDIFTAAYALPPAHPAQGADRLRQDALRRVHGPHAAGLER